MKKIIAQQMDIENFDYEMYYDEEQAYYDMIWAGGNRDFKDFNADLKEDVAKALDNCNYDLTNIDEDDSYESEEDKNEDRLYACKSYFKALTTNKLTDEQFYKLGDLSREYYNCPSMDELNIICEALSILHNKKFVTGIIKGCSQGDWMKVIYPEGYANIKWIEAVLFATGTEFKIAEVDLPDDFDLTNVNALIDALDNAKDSYFDYTDKWNTDDVKEWIISSTYGDYKKDDVIMLEITKSYTIIQHEYKTI